GDVVTHVGGTTSEVTNTDAEGRMVLADGLSHGISVCDPDIVLDVATLTGAMKVALGMRTGALMATDDDLAERIATAGAESGERWAAAAERRPAGVRPLHHRRPQAGPDRARGDHGGTVPRGLCRRPRLGPPRHRGPRQV